MTTMTKEQVFQLKLAALQFATQPPLDGTDILTLAESMYQWLTKEVTEAEQAQQAAKQAGQVEVKLAN